MIPISDDNPTRRRPIVNWVVIASCVLVYLVQISLTEDQHDAALGAFAFVPVSVFGSSGDSTAFPFPDWAWLTLITSMFMHGGLLHLGGNMLYLWIFGNNVEDAMGHGRYFVFYLLVGIAATAAEGLMDPSSTIPVIGASGAISGVLAAYVLVFPRARVTVVVPLGVLLYPMKISAIFVVGFWFVLQLMSAAMANPGEPGVAWWAHIGGFIAGAILIPFFSQYPLFGRRRLGPWG